MRLAEAMDLANNRLSQCKFVVVSESLDLDSDYLEVTYMIQKGGMLINVEDKSVYTNYLGDDWIGKELKDVPSDLQDIINKHSFKED